MLNNIHNQSMYKLFWFLFGRGGAREVNINACDRQYISSDLHDFMRVAHHMYGCIDLVIRILFTFVCCRIDVSVYKRRALCISFVVDIFGSLGHLSLYYS